MAEPLYLGEEEYNTDDRAVMALIIEHCSGLQQEGAAVSKTAEPQREEEDEEDRQDSDAGRAEAFAKSPSIKADGLASGDDKGETPDLSRVTVGYCAATGIIY